MTVQSAYMVICLRTNFYQLKELVAKILEICEKYRYSLFLKISIEGKICLYLHGASPAAQR